MTISVIHNAEDERFEAVVEGHTCVAEYHLRDGVMWMTYTGVPAAVGGRGIAAELVRAALAHARARGWKVMPSCSYVAAYMQRHPDTQDLLARRA
jgi:predicted GNAT family acetyltransferase